MFQVRFVRAISGFAVMTGTAVLATWIASSPINQRPVESTFNPQPIYPTAPVEFCFAKGTPPSVIEYYTQVMRGAFSHERYYLLSHWNATPVGSPQTVTWSLVPDGTTFSDAAGTSVLFSNMDSQFSGSGGRATWVNRIQQCFDRWHQLCGITFTRITTGGNDWDDGAQWGSSAANATRGQIRISSRNIDGGSNVLAYTYGPQNGDVVMDSSENWSNSTNLNRFMRNTLTHELGHAIGLAHVCSTDSQQLMEPILATGFDGPRHDDIRGVQHWYGDVHEDDNSAATADFIGTAEVGSPINLDALPNPISGTNPTNTGPLSIDANNEQDFFQFAVNGYRQATIVITPTGFTYDNSSQDGTTGNCNSGNPLNSLAITDLALDVIDTDGTTVLTTASVNSAGLAETAVVDLPVAGNYYARVYSANATVPSTQMYKLNLSVTAPCITPSISAIPSASTACGSPYTSPAPSATGTPTITWSLTTGPGGMTINPANGVVSWPIPISSPTPYTVTVKATNGCGNDSKTWFLTVKPGDVDGDGVLTQVDIDNLVNQLLGGAGVFCAGDVNGDGNIDGLDAQAFENNI